MMDFPESVAARWTRWVSFYSAGAASALPRRDREAAGRQEPTRVEGLLEPKGRHAGMALPRRARRTTLPPSITLYCSPLPSAQRPK